MRVTVPLLLLLASCTAVEPESRTPAPNWVYEPPLPVWQTGEPRGRFGRSQAPQLATTGGIVGDAKVPLRAIAVWPLPNGRALIDGLEGGVQAIELVDIDAGRVVWRSTTACAEPVIAVTASTIVCGRIKGLRGVDFEGRPKWKTDDRLRSITGTRIVAGNELAATKVLDADTGKELAQTAMRELWMARSVGSCDGELFVYDRDMLARIADGKPGMAWFRSITESASTVTWERPLDKRPIPPSMYRVDALDCSAEPILVASSGRGTSSLIAIARATGKTIGRVEDVRGWWRARDGSDRIEIATAGGVAIWSRDLTAFESTTLPPLGALLDAREDRRLVRATPLTAAVVDARGVASYVSLAATSAALGKTAIVGVVGGAVRRVPIPPRSSRVVRVPPRRAGVALPAELRDLPESAKLAGAEIPKPDTGKHGIAAIALDPDQPHALFVATLEQEEPGPTTTSPISRLDLANRAWTWQRTDGCGPGVPIGLALARDLVACATRGTEATVRATSRDGMSRWDWVDARIDAIAGAGDAVLVTDADRVTVLDAGTGKVRGRLASDDGAPMRAALVEVPNASLVMGGEAIPTTWLVTYERGRLVARLPSVSMLAVWSLAVDGVVAAIAPSASGVLVTLDDGDAYRIALPSGGVTPMPGLGLAWRATGELITGETAGGPIYGEPRPPPERPRLPFIPGQPQKPLFDAKTPVPPTLWIPIPEPEVIRRSWQYTLYERDGALRARNDYDLSQPIVGPRGPAGSPLVLTQYAWDVIVLDPRTGDPLRRVELPPRTPGKAFGTLVEGKPVAGVVLGSPLRVVLF